MTGFTATDQPSTTAFDTDVNITTGQPSATQHAANDVTTAKPADPSAANLKAERDTTCNTKPYDGTI